MASKVDGRSGSISTSTPVKQPAPAVSSKASPAPSETSKGWGPRGANGKGRAAKAAQPASTPRGSAELAELKKKGLELDVGTAVAKTTVAMSPRQLAAAAFGVPAAQVSERQLALLGLSSTGLLPAGSSVSLAATPKGLALRKGEVEDRLSRLDAAIADGSLSGREHFSAVAVRDALRTSRADLGRAQHLVESLSQLGVAETSAAAHAALGHADAALAAFEPMRAQVKALTASKEPEQARLGAGLAPELLLGETDALAQSISALASHGQAGAAHQLIARETGKAEAALPRADFSSALALDGRQAALHALDGQLSARAAAPGAAHAVSTSYGKATAALGKVESRLRTEASTLDAASAAQLHQHADAAGHLTQAVAAEQHTALAQVHAAQGNPEAQRQSLVDGLAAALGQPSAQVKAALTPTEAHKLNDDGSAHQWYQVGNLFTAHKVKFVAEPKVKALADSVLALPPERQQAAVDALARYADASAGAGEVSDLNAAKQVLHAVADRSGQPQLKVASALAEGQLHLALGDAKQARASYVQAQGLAEKVPDAAARKQLSTQAVLGRATALANLASSASHDEKKAAAHELRGLRLEMEKHGAPLDKDQAARLSLMEMSSYLAADLSAEAVKTMDHVRAQYGQDAGLPWVKQALDAFAKEKHKGGVGAFIQAALHEANSETAKEGLAAGMGGAAVGAAAGAAVGALFFGVGAVPGAFFGATVGGAVSTLALKARNIIRGASQISQAGHTGYSNQTVLESALDATALAVDVAAAVAPLKGLGSVGKVGMTALTGVGSQASKAEAQVLMKGLAARVEQATVQSMGEQALKQLGAKQVETMSKQMLMREVFKQTSAFGGKWMTRGALVSLVTPMATQMYKIQTSDMNAAQKSRARGELAAHFAQGLVTTAITMAPMMALGHFANNPPGATAEMRNALKELAPSESQVRALSPEEFKAYVQQRRAHLQGLDLSPEMKAQLEARYKAIGLENVAAFDPVTGNVVVNSAVLGDPQLQAVLGHELAHQRMHSISGAQRGQVVDAFTGSDQWGAIKKHFLEQNPAAAGYTNGQIVDEVLAEVHGQPSSALARLTQPILDSKALRSAGLSEAPRLDVETLRRTGSLRISDRTYFNRSGERDLVGFSEADGPDASANWSRLDDTQKQALRDADANAKTLSAAAHAQLVARAQSLGYSEADLKVALDHIKNNSEVTVNFTPDRNVTPGGYGSVAAGQQSLIDNLTAEGTYKNQFETKISGGALAPTAGSMRDNWERTIFRGDYHAHDLIPQERPKYGAMDAELNPTGGANCYGNSFMVLKDGAKNRMTFTPFNSSGATANDVGTAENFEHILANPRLPNDKFQAIMNQALGKPVSTPGYGYNYIEMQLHGPLDFAKDVASVVANASYKGTPYESKLRAFVQKFGINLSWTDGRAVTPDVAPVVTPPPSVAPVVPTPAPAPVVTPAG